MRLLSALWLLGILIFVSVTVFAQENIVSGEPVEGTLTENELSAEYTFEGEAGDVVSLTLSSRRFDSYLTLETAEGVEVASNDDSGGSLDAAIENVALPETGTYTVIVTSANGTGTGNFVLNLTYSGIDSIEYGESVQGEISETVPSNSYRFEGTAGDVIIISMTSNQFDTFLTLSNGSYDLFSDDDGGEGTNSLIIGYVLPDTGTYFINARGYSNFSFGQYTLQVNRVEVVPIEVNTTIEAELDGSVLMYSFDAAIGDTLDVDVVGHDGLDTSLTLNDPGGYVIYTDDDSGNDLNPEIHDRVLEAEGTHTLLVQPVDSNAVGSYSLTVNLHKPQLLECGQTENVSYTSKQQNQSFVFEVPARGSFALTFSEETGSVSNLSIRAFREGEFLSVQTDSSQASQLIITPAVSRGGTFTVLVGNYSYRAESFTMELECEE